MEYLWVVDKKKAFEDVLLGFGETRLTFSPFFDIPRTKQLINQENNKQIIQQWK